ncbi:MAG TPA: hypothetical protein VF659_09315 [Pyrinomonadaceae bacterium]
MTGIGNGSVAVLSFLSSFTVGGQALLDLVVRVLVMFLVAMLGKAVDVLFKLYLERRRERRRARAIRAGREPAGLKGDAS